MYIVVFLLYEYVTHPDLHSFPTRRSSDLYKANFKDGFPSPSLFAYLYYINTKATLDALDAVKGDLDRKSTRLNSSHVRISYAVFCLKKKKIQNALPLIHIKLFILTCVTNT